MYQKPMGRFHCTVTQEDDGEWSFYVQDLNNVGDELVEMGACSTEAEALEAVESAVAHHSAVFEE